MSSRWSLLLLLAATPVLAVDLPERQDGTILIATFNIRIFSDGSRDDGELRQICRVPQHFDLIAVQEVRDTRILDRAVAMLATEYGLTYEYAASPKVGRRQKEIYEVLHRPDKVQATGEGGVIGDDEDLFIREPFWIQLQAGEFDFYLVTIHSIYGDPQADREVLPGTSAAAATITQPPTPPRRHVAVVIEHCHGAHVRTPQAPGQFPGGTPRSCYHVAKERRRMCAVILRPGMRSPSTRMRVVISSEV